MQRYAGRALQLQQFQAQPVMVTKQFSIHPGFANQGLMEEVGNPADERRLPLDLPMEANELPSYPLGTRQRSGLARTTGQPIPGNKYVSRRAVTTRLFSGTPPDITIRKSRPSLLTVLWTTLSIGNIEHIWHPYLDSPTIAVSWKSDPSAAAARAKRSLEGVAAFGKL